MLGPPATQDFQNTISCQTLTNRGTKQWWVSYSKHTWNAPQTGSLQTSRSDMEEREGAIGTKNTEEDKEMKWWEERSGLREGGKAEEIYEDGEEEQGQGGTKDKSLKVERGCTYHSTSNLRVIIRTRSKPRVTKISLGFSPTFKKNNTLKKTRLCQHTQWTLVMHSMVINIILGLFYTTVVIWFTRRNDHFSIKI